MGSEPHVGERWGHGSPRHARGAGMLSPFERRVLLAATRSRLHRGAVLPSAAMAPWPRATARRLSPALMVLAGHMAVVAGLFPGLLFQGQVPYFRDLASHYFPSFVLLSRAAEQGIAWPLWNPWSNAGEPFLDPYPVNLLLVRVAGPLGALRWDAPLHVLLAMSGMSLCARRRGASWTAAWAAGAFYGAGGFVLSSANSLQFFHATCWAPLVLAAFLGVIDKGRRSDLAWLGLAAAAQLSTMGADVMMQTALIGAFLLPRRPRFQDVLRLSVAGVVVLLLSAPALLGTRWALEGTRRAAGFAAEEVLTYSASPVALAEVILPRFLGDVHTFTDRGFWGQAFFSSGYPYFVSLYLGPCVLALTLLGCRGPGSRSLLLLAVLGTLLSLGAKGPLADVIPLVLRHFRFPVKFFLLVHLPVCLLAARGIDALVERVPSWLRFAPVVLLGIAGAVAALAPSLPGSLLGSLIPSLRDPRALIVISLSWPFFFLRSAGLALAFALALGLRRRGLLLATGIVAVDLILVNAVCHPSTSATFYTLRPAFREAVAAAARHGAYRWFSFGVSNSPGLTFDPRVVATNSDVFLYYVDRQSLWGSAHVIDGIETAYQEEHSFAPAGATLSIEERQPARFRDFAERLRFANVRWIASFRDLPPDLAVEMGRVPFPEILQPLRVYELQQSLPRAYWTPTLAGDLVRPGAPPTGTVPKVAVDKPNLHTISLRADTPAGFIVLVEGYNASWRATRAGVGVTLGRINGRYMALATPGGPQDFTLSLAPGWRWPALAGLGVGLLVAGAMLLPQRGRMPDAPNQLQA